MASQFNGIYRHHSALFGFVIVMAQVVSSPGFAQTSLDKKTLPVTFWDFNAGSPAEFQGGCEGGKGMVTGLDADRKPTQVGATTCPDVNVNNWFRSTPTNARYCRDLVLTQKANTENTYEKIDNNFFPLDSVPTNQNQFKGSDGRIHNFHFCMEMHASFKYRGGELLDFTGDDDVWFFVNNKLALDLGGKHSAQNGSVDLDAQANSLSIEKGNYYNFDFFFCERQTTDSHLRITTSIDILPPPPPGFHIADANGLLLHLTDTLTLKQNAGEQSLKSIEIKSEQQVVDCSSITKELQNPVISNWLIDGAPQLTADHILFNPANLSPGIHTITMEKNGQTFLVKVNILAQPLIPRPKALSGSYRDINGDGRIETAVVLFDTNFKSPPEKVEFDDPFAPGQSRMATVLSQRNQEVTMVFDPMMPGTGFPSAPLGHIPAGVSGFDAQNILIADSVGPVVANAVSQPAGSDSVQATLEATFSEAISALPEGFPFEVKRGSASLNSAEFIVSQKQIISAQKIRFVFAKGSKYPIPGDSLRISASAIVKDVLGNFAHQNNFIGVVGNAAKIPATLEVSVSHPLVQGPAGLASPGTPGVVVHSLTECFNCTDEKTRALISDTAHIPGPTLDVKALYPFKYKITAFDHLGQFDYDAKGALDATVFYKLPKDKQGKVLVKITLLPYAKDGALLGTGAYILRGRFEALASLEVGKGPQGEPIQVLPIAELVTRRIGFIRGP